MMLLAQLPDIAWLAVGAVILFLVVALGGSIFLREMRALRSGLADELKREIEAAKTPSPVSVQQPFEVTPVQRFATKEEHERHVAKVEDEFRRERSSRKLIYEKIEAQGTSIAKLETETEIQTRTLATMDGKMDQLLMRMPRSS